MSFRESPFFSINGGDSPEKKTANDLFAFHLEDTTDVLVYYNEDFPELNTMVISEKSGNKTLLKTFSAHADTVITGSPARNRFALKWNINAESVRANFKLHPKFSGQQINMLGLSYWLSRCKVTGEIGETRLSGKGYIHIRKQLPGDK